MTLTTLSMRAGIAILLALPALAQTSKNSLANNTVLIVRHAEKPETGTGLRARGEARAALYVHYFEPFHEDGMSVKVDCLYAGADSQKSFRPRLTLEPLAKATGMPLHDQIGTKEPERLVHELETTEHGAHPLVSWRHGEIPALLTAFGAAPEKLLPGGKWPDEVFDWVIVLKMGSDGKLTDAKLVHEHLEIAEK